MNTKEIKEKLAQIIYDESSLHQHCLEYSVKKEGNSPFYLDEDESDLIIVGWDDYIPNINERHLILKNSKGELIRYKVSIAISNGRKVKE